MGEIKKLEIGEETYYMEKKENKYVLYTSSELDGVLCAFWPYNNKIQMIKTLVTAEEINAITKFLIRVNQDMRYTEPEVKELDWPSLDDPTRL